VGRTADVDVFLPATHTTVGFARHWLHYTHCIHTAPAHALHFTFTTVHVYSWLHTHSHTHTVTHTHTHGLHHVFATHVYSLHTRYTVGWLDTLATRFVWFAPRVHSHAHLRSRLLGPVHAHTVHAHASCHPGSSYLPRLFTHAFAFALHVCIRTFSLVVYVTGAFSISSVGSLRLRLFGNGTAPPWHVHRYVAPLRCGYLFVAGCARFAFVVC